MLSPGPANLVSFILGTRNGLRRLLPFQLGILLVYAIVALVLGFLTQRIAEFSPQAIAALQVIGGLFIIYLGVRMTQRTKRDAEHLAPTFLNGVVLQCLNPKYPGVVLAVFANQHKQPTVVTAFILCLVGTLGLLLYATAGSLLRIKHTERYMGKVDTIAGVLLCCVGVWFILQAVAG